MSRFVLRGEAIFGLGEEVTEEEEARGVKPEDEGWFLRVGVCASCDLGDTGADAIRS